MPTAQAAAEYAGLAARSGGNLERLLERIATADATEYAVAVLAFLLLAYVVTRLLDAA